MEDLVAFLLTLVDVDFAGRAYAAYGGIYIAASLSWLWALEGRLPDRWDVVGVAVCLLGAGIILLGPREAAHGLRIVQPDVVPCLELVALRDAP